MQQSYSIVCFIVVQCTLFTSTAYTCNLYYLTRYSELTNFTLWTLAFVCGTTPLSVSRKYRSFLLFKHLLNNAVNSIFKWTPVKLWKYWMFLCILISSRFDFNFTMQYYFNIYLYVLVLYMGKGWSTFLELVPDLFVITVQ